MVVTKIKSFPKESVILSGFEESGIQGFEWVRKKCKEMRCNRLEVDSRQG
jgi:hypothetical protein